MASSVYPCRYRALSLSPWLVSADDFAKLLLLDHDGMLFFDIFPLRNQRHEIVTRLR
jgi:hypothetical protein